jgi:hypothetical protein
MPYEGSIFGINTPTEKIKEERLVEKLTVVSNCGR